MQRKTTPTAKAKSPAPVTAAKRATVPAAPAAPAPKIEAAKPVPAAAKSNGASTPATSTKPKAAAAKLAPEAPKLKPTNEQIARRAYELYLARGQSHGHDQADWAQAERELLAITLKNN